MKNTLTIALTGFIFLSICAPSIGQNLNQVQKSTLEKQVDSAFLIMVTAAENLDYDKISTGVDDKYNAGFIINNTYYARYDSMINILKSNLRAGAKQNINIHKRKISVISSNIALLTATGESNIEFSSGQSFHITFFWSFVFEKFGNEWKVVHSHQSQLN